MTRYTRLAPDIAPNVDTDSRVIEYTFSDESVGRDGYIVRTDAWQTDNFEANPVFLWMHSDDQPPIGRVFGLHAVGKLLKGSVRYAETDFAETIYQLVKSRFLSATSTSWVPLKGGFERSNDPDIKGTFTAVDLLEISQVNVPALPTALAGARSRGLNLRPLARWAERALDTGRYTGPRCDVEALYRAARPLETRADRARRAREIIERIERENFAAEIRERVEREDAEARRRGETW